MFQIPWPGRWLLALFFFTIMSTEASPLSAAPQGIQFLGVEISGIEQNYARYGLDPVKLRGRILRQLEAAGFTIVPAEESSIPPPEAVLQIRIRLVRAYFGYPYGITAELVQKLPLVAPAGGFAPIVTWSKSQTGVVRLPELAHLNDYTAAVVAQFIEAVSSPPPAQ